MKKCKRICPICGCIDNQELYQIKMVIVKDMPIPSSYDVVSCSHCGFCYADVDASQENYNDYYYNFNNYSQIADLKTTMTESADATRIAVFDKYIEKDAKILDIGCGSGSFLKLLKEKGYNNVFGLDPSKASIDHLHGFGINGRVGNVFDSVDDEYKNAFDVVIFTMVMEHIYDLQNIITNLKKFIVKDGYLFIEVPAAEGFGKYPTLIPNYFNREHINYFDRESLDNLLFSNSFERVNDEDDCLFDIPMNLDRTRFETILHGLYRENPEKEHPIQKSTAGLKSITEYFKYMNEFNDRMYGLLDHIFEKHDKCIVWGTGSLTMFLLANYENLNQHVFCFVDNNTIKVGTELEDRKIISPNEIANVDLDIPILICSIYNVKEIRQQIKDMQIQNPCYSFEEM